MGKTRTRHFERLQKRWIARHQAISKKLWLKHAEALRWAEKNVSSQQLAAGSLGGLMLLAAPAVVTIPTPLSSTAQEVTQTLPRSTFLIADLAKALPDHVRSLTKEEEDEIGSILTRTFGYNVSAALEGMRLNRSYGVIGAEQHLARFPGDSLAIHFNTTEEARMFASAGMAPGLGAWGYFAPSKAQMSDQESVREKYNIAVQTFLAQDYYQRSLEYATFFKYRKMLVVNPQNGKAIVVVVGDVGPATWTGKHLGGSPEVMQYLERVDGPARGPVLFFFIDDQKDAVPLGPIETYNRNVG